MVIGQFGTAGGGAERQCLKLSRELLRRGHEVRVYTSCQYPRRCGWDRFEDIPICRVGYPVIAVKGRRIAGLGGWCRYGLAVELVRSAALSDLVHVHQGLWPAFSAALAGSMTGKPLICKIANSGERFDLSVLGKEIIAGLWEKRLVKRRVDSFVATSSAVLADLTCEGIAAEKIALIPSGVEIPPQDAPPAAGKPVFVFVGSLTAKKNAAALIDSARRLRESRSGDFEVMIVGDGPERARLEAAAAAAGVSGSVRFCGSVTDVGRYLSAARAFVLPSFTEGLSNAALEAMAAGLPLILSDRGGNPDLIESAAQVMPGVRKGINGFVCDIRSPAALTAAMERCLRSPEETASMGRHSRELAQRRFSINKTADEYEILYERLLTQRR